MTYLLEVRDNIIDAGAWEPLDSLMTETGDLTIVFIQHNNVIHQTANNDHAFRANMSFKGPGPFAGQMIYYRPFHRVSPMSCLVKHPYCTLDRRICTTQNNYGNSASELLSPELDFTPEQRAKAIRIMLAAWVANIYDVVAARPQSALQPVYRPSRLL